MKVCFFYLLSTPLSPQCPSSWGYSDGEWRQWDCHRGLLATSSRRGAERGGPGVQGNKKTCQQLPQVWASGTSIVEIHKGDTNRDADRADNRERDNAQTWKGNEFLVEAHLWTLLSALPLCDVRTEKESKAWELLETVVKQCHLVEIVDSHILWCWAVRSNFCGNYW